MPKTDQRSLKQNNALHAYCSEVADMLNEAGIQKSVFYKNIYADFTMENIKELWRSIARAKYGKDSTKDLTKDELQSIYEEINRHLAQFHIHIAFPSSDFNNLVENYEN